MHSAIAMKNSTPAVLPGVLGKWFILIAFEFSHTYQKWPQGFMVSWLWHLCFPSFYSGLAQMCPGQNFCCYMAAFTYNVVMVHSSHLTSLWRQVIPYLIVLPPNRTIGLNTGCLLVYMACLQTLF